MEITELNEKIKQESQFVDDLFSEIGKVIVGQKEMIQRLVIGLLGNGHVLLEGLPGLAKTLAINSLASSMDAKFQRIQFTPDLLPADLLGTMIYNFVLDQASKYVRILIGIEGIVFCQIPSNTLCKKRGGIPLRRIG